MTGRFPLVLLSLALLGAPTAAAPVRALDARASARIVNGTLTAAHPTTVAIGTPAGGFCSGVLIGCRTVLTAAHCFCGPDVLGVDCQPTWLTDPSSTVVFLQHAGFFAVTDVTVHPAFNFAPTPAPGSYADLAVVTLATPVAGIAPTPLATAQDPPVGSRGTIVGFGSIGASHAIDVGTGLKRVGAVTTATCAAADLVCWDFTGPDANTCHGDSGGPLFVDFGGSPVVAGITSGGTSDTCTPPDQSYDASVFSFASWIQGIAGADLLTTSCGPGPQVGDPGSQILSAAASFDPAHQGILYSLGVSPNTGVLRVGLNGTLDPDVDADLLIRAGAPPTADAYDCAALNGSTFDFCEVPSPRPGSWFVLVVGHTGSGDYQLTTTTLGGDPPVCGNGIHEADEECDGSDAPSCLAGCGSNCACRPCTENGFALQNYNLAPRFLVKGTLAAPDLDPRQGDLSLAITDRQGGRAEVVVPAAARWKGRRGRYRWRGRTDGLRQVTLRRRGGAWALTVSGRNVPSAAKLASPLERIVVSVGGVCGTRTFP